MQTQVAVSEGIDTITEKEFQKRVIDQQFNWSNDIDYDNIISNINHILKEEGKISFTDPTYMKLFETERMQKNLENGLSMRTRIASGYNGYDFKDIGKFLDFYSDFEFTKKLIEETVHNSAHYDGRRLATANGKASLHLSNNEITLQEGNEERIFSNIEPYQEIKSEYNPNEIKKEKPGLLKSLYALAFKA